VISISTTTFDLNGHIDIDPVIDSPDGETVRRVSRVPTLDGGVATNDRGYSEGDRTLEYFWRPVSRAHNDAIDRIVRLYPQVYVSTPSGVYLAAPQSFTPGVTECSISLLVIEKVSE
jgi:hypothetical protein